MTTDIILDIYSDYAYMNWFPAEDCEKSKVFRWDGSFSLQLGGEFTDPRLILLSVREKEKKSFLIFLISD